MYAKRNRPSRSCLRPVWGVEHSLPSGRLTSAGAPTSALASPKRPGPAPASSLALTRGWHLLKVTPGHGRLKATARAAVRQRGRGLGWLLAPSGAGVARWFPAAPRRPGTCTSRPGLASFPAAGAVTRGEPSAGRALPPARPTWSCGWRWGWRCSAPRWRRRRPARSGPAPPWVSRPRVSG